MFAHQRKHKYFATLYFCPIAAFLPFSFPPRIGRLREGNSVSSADAFLFFDALSTIWLFFCFYIHKQGRSSWWGLRETRHCFHHLTGHTGDGGVIHVSGTSPCSGIRRPLIPGREGSQTSEPVNATLYLKTVDYGISSVLALINWKAGAKIIKKNVFLQERVGFTRFWSRPQMFLEKLNFICLGESG